MFDAPLESSGCWLSVGGSTCQSWSSSPLSGRQNVKFVTLKMVDFQEDGSLDVVFDIISWRFKQFWIPLDRGYKIRPLGGIADRIRNVRNLRMALRYVIFEETAVLRFFSQGIRDIQPVLDSNGQSDNMGQVWVIPDLIMNVRNLRNAIRWVILEETAVLRVFFFKVSRRFNLFWIPHGRGDNIGPVWCIPDPITNVRNLRNANR